MSYACNWPFASKRVLGYILRVGYNANYIPLVNVYQS